MKNEPTKVNEMNELIFISRHEPNNGQVALAKEMGYDRVLQINIAFLKDPVSDLERAGITKKIIAVVAPSYITNILLNKGYTLIEFVNSSIKREKMVFCCEGAYKYRLNTEKCMIEQEYISCPITIEEQVESSLVPTKREV